LAKGDITPLLLISSVTSCQVASCHGCRLGFNWTGNSAIWSTGHGHRKPHPRTIEVDQMTRCEDMTIRNLT